MDDNEYNVLNLDDVKCFLKEQVSRLELDKSALLKVKVSLIFILFRPEVQWIILQGS